MLITDFGFTEYYHQYMTFEADDLTEMCRGNIDVQIDDCYALCSSWINEEGELQFNVLAIGPSWETCTKGLEQEKMLAQFSMEDVMNCQVRMAVPDFSMVHKNAPFLKENDGEADEELMELRCDERLDDIRDIIFPDTVELTYFSHDVLNTCEMRLKEVKGPFIVGEIMDVDEDSDISIGELTYALPYIGPEGIGLLRVYGDDSMDEDEEEMLQEIIRAADAFGLGFEGVHLKN